MSLTPSDVVGAAVSEDALEPIAKALCLCFGREVNIDRMAGSNIEYTL